jgi:hypothetical protein
MNETKNDDLEKTADGDPLIDRGTADSARDSVTEPEEEDDAQTDDDEEKEAEEDVDL